MKLKREVEIPEPSDDGVPPLWFFVVVLPGVISIAFGLIVAHLFT